MATVKRRAQREAVWRVFCRDCPLPILSPALEAEAHRLHYRRYRRWRKAHPVQPAFGLDVVMLPWAGMWLGIEPDGYTHS